MADFEVPRYYFFSLAWKGRKKKKLTPFLRHDLDGLRELEEKSGGLLNRKNKKASR